MGYYEKMKKRIYIYIAIIIAGIYYYINGPIYECPKVDKSSRWYVNDIYMSTQYYYDNLLDTDEKSVYWTMLDKIKNMEPEFYVNAKPEQVEKAWHALTCDHPELINVIRVSFKTYEDHSSVEPTYYTNSKFLLKLKERSIQRKIGKIVKKVEGKSEYEKEKYVYQWIGERSSYEKVEEKKKNESAYTAFYRLDTTVNEGYAKASQILLSNVGVNSIININSEYLWNTVRLDNEYYFFDATVTDTTRRAHEGNISYIGLNQNQETSNHEIIYPTVLPKVQGEKYNYYNKENLTMKYSSEKINIIKRIIDNSEFDKVEIRFTNPDEASAEINEKYLKQLNIKKIEATEGYYKDSGVLIFVKN